MKLNFKPKLTYLALLFIVGNFLSGCVIDDQINPENRNLDQGLLEETKTWYQEDYQSGSNARLLNLIKENIPWEKAKTGEYNGHQYVEVPIGLTLKNILLKRSSELFETEGIYRLLIFKSPTGKFTPYIFKAESKSESFNEEWNSIELLSFENIPESFTGTYAFFKPVGTFVGEYLIKTGKIDKAISYKGPKSPDSKGARISTWNYSCTVTTYTTYVQAGDGDPEIVEQYEVWDCEFTYVPDQLAGPGDGGGGGGGGNEPEPCYEPHPQFHGFLVPCGSLDDDCPCCNVPPSERVLCEQQAPPCDDLPTHSIEIQNTADWTGKNSGRYSATARKFEDGSPKPHWGLDIAANPGTPVFSVHSGEVVKVESNIPPNKYVRDSFGNFVKIKSRKSSGEVFYLQYSHLNYV
ncbi:M23 family metallopeptidase [Algoriphagus namhaensis]